MNHVRRAARCAGIAGLAGVLAATVTTATVLVSPAPQTGEAAGPRAHVWMTTADGTEKMHDRGSVAFERGSRSGQLTITVDPSRRYQTMDGFGASITDSSASVLMELDRSAR